MGIFGFGKKKDHQPAQQKAEPKPVHTPMDDAVSDFLKGLNNSSPAQDPHVTTTSSTTTSSKVWSESVDKFLARNDDAKLVKLTGKPEELAFYEVGNRCHVEEDYEKEKFAVTLGGSVIGYLPSSAVTYAQKHETVPEDLNVIIAEVEYEIEKERDIISVYIA